MVASIFGRSESRGLLALIGVLSTIAGLILIKKPFETLVASTLILGMWFVVAGLVGLVSALASSEARGGTILIALLDLTAGAVILAWPDLSLSTVAVIIGIGLVGLDVPLHVDGASGGFVWPFLYPDSEWDFRLEQVRSINVSGHKYGLVYPGIGWLVFRETSDLAEDLVFYENYLGKTDATFTLNFSTGSAMVLAQYRARAKTGTGY